MLGLEPGITFSNPWGNIQVSGKQFIILSGPRALLLGSILIMFMECILNFNCT